MPSKRQTPQEALISRLLSILSLSSTPSDALPEAIRKALLAAYHQGYSHGLEDNLAGAPKKP